MWKNKKWIIIGVVAAVVILVAGIVGAAVVNAQSPTPTPTPSANNPGKAFADRVATILGIDQAKVENAFAQAQKDMRNEAMSNRLKGLVAQGKITQQQADEYLKWWESRPNLPAQLGPNGPMMGPKGDFRGMPMMPRHGNFSPKATPGTPSPKVGS